MAISGVQHIIFDLGGVIIDIDPHLSFRALSDFYRGDQPGEKLLTENVTLFLDFEKGLISSEDFRSGIRSLTLNNALSDQEIDDAWNKMLLNIPAERFSVLEKIRPDYQLFVLSNTNAIHVPAFNKIVEKSSGKADIGHFFDKVYFSHEMQLRKPEEQIYRQLLDENQLPPHKTLFIDDRLENIEAAASLGMQTFHIKEGRGIVDFFNS
jgi:putative hydrolase of the HAD superfamily